MWRLPRVISARSSTSPQMPLTSFRAEPGATKEKAPPSNFSRGSFRTARRKPSTAAMVRPPSPISKRAPV